MNWEDRADCKDRDPRMWDGEDEYLTGKAKQICHRCPVRSDCLVDAMVNELNDPEYKRHTIRGAHTPLERSDYNQEFIEKFGRDLDLLKAKYKRKSLDLGGRQERRLEKSRLARNLLSPAHPRFDDYREVLDMVIAKPWATAEELGKRISKSTSYVQHTLCEAWEVAV